ncbi:UNVERIFIED_CONTAM: hypothetical protein GTU68_020495 [Idotea baltica]|nr:hypothetical protein [Idotea baltica]
MAKRDFYEVLEVSRTASEAEIKKAYRRMAMKYHPDRNAGDADTEEKFKEAKEAYEILSNAQKRAAYDQFGHDGVDQSMGGGQRGGGGFSDVFGDVFNDIFGASGGGRQGGYRGADLRYHLEMALEDAVVGKTVEIRIPTNIDCKTCDGTGAKPGTDPVTCTTCGGHGQVFTRDDNNLFCDVPISFTTATLGGELQVPTLAGKASLKVPEGTQTGQQFRLKGKGVKSVRSGVTGDLMCRVMIETPVKLSKKQKELLQQFAETLESSHSKHSPKHSSWLDKVKEFFD